MSLLEIPGRAADHLYREGSAKASFWETIFGSSLRAKRRTHVSARPDGTRVFDVPLLDTEREILRRAEAWTTAHAPAAAPFVARELRVRLIGLQPRGQAVASFSLSFERASDKTPDSEVGETLRQWIEAEGARLADDILIPFGFTPQPSQSRQSR